MIWVTLLSEESKPLHCQLHMFVSSFVTVSPYVFPDVLPAALNMKSQRQGAMLLLLFALSEVLEDVFSQWVLRISACFSGLKNLDRS